MFLEWLNRSVRIYIEEKKKTKQNKGSKQIRRKQRFPSKKKKKAKIIPE